MDRLAHIFAAELAEMPPEEAADWLTDLRAAMSEGYSTEEAHELVSDSPWGG